MAVMDFSETMVWIAGDNIVRILVVLLEATGAVRGGGRNFAD